MRRKRLLLIPTAVVLALGFLVGELNVLDYQQFHSAIAKADRLTPGECLAMADFCQRARKEREYGAVEAPPPFRVLDPRGVRVTPGGAEAILHELGAARVTLWVESAGANQRVRYTVHARPARAGRVVWTRQPETLAEAEKWSPTEGHNSTAGTATEIALPWWCVWRRWAD